MSAEIRDWDEAVRLNRARWDCLAEVHGQDAYYDTEALLAGEDTLTVEEDEVVRGAVGDVTGLDVLHVQCHIGFDTISFARRGARVTGADFSAASLDKARNLAEHAESPLSGFRPTQRRSLADSLSASTWHTRPLA